MNCQRCGNLLNMAGECYNCLGLINIADDEQLAEITTNIDGHECRLRRGPLKDEGQTKGPTTDE